MRRLQRALIVFCFMGVAAGILAADDGQPSPDPSQPQQVAKPCVAVLGHVAEPRVFETAEPCPLLMDVVKQAGGLTEDASHNARIIRQGLAGRQSFFTSRSNFRLQPGDVVVVEGTLSSRREHFVQVAATDAGTGDKDATVELALVNLLPYPVVVQLPAEEATKVGLIAYLNQEGDAIGSLEIFENSNAHLLRGGPITPLTLLESGTVVVFDPTLIDFSRLPKLPDVQPVAHAAAPSQLAVHAASAQLQQSVTASFAPIEASAPPAAPAQAPQASPETECSTAPAPEADCQTSSQPQDECEAVCQPQTECESACEPQEECEPACEPACGPQPNASPGLEPKQQDKPGLQPEPEADLPYDSRSEVTEAVLEAPAAEDSADLGYHRNEQAVSLPGENDLFDAYWAYWNEAAAQGPLAAPHPAASQRLHSRDVEPAAMDSDGPSLAPDESPLPEPAAAIEQPNSTASNLFTAIIALAGCGMTVVAFGVLWSTARNGGMVETFAHAEELLTNHRHDPRCDDELFTINEPAGRSTAFEHDESYLPHCSVDGQHEARAPHFSHDVAAGSDQATTRAASGTIRRDHGHAAIPGGHSHAPLNRANADGQSGLLGRVLSSVNGPSAR